ncbi:MAG: hypothetical protein ACJ8HI_19995 [Massilia sp.]
MTTHTDIRPAAAKRVPDTAAAPLSSIGAGVEAARQWRLLALWALLTLIPALVLALPLWRLLGASFDYTIGAPALAAELDLLAIADVVNNYTRNGATAPLAGVQALVVTLLLSPLLTAMTICAARAPATARPGFRALLAGGVDDYLRMARMLLVAVLPLIAAAALGGVARSMADRYSETAVLASSAAAASLAASIVMALLLVLAHATIDAGRAVLALDRRRRSAFLAWWQGCKLLVRRPLALMRAYLPITIVALLVAAALSLARIHLPRVDGAGFAASLLLTQLIVVVLGWMRIARLFALIGVARTHVVK